jgi:hypothetical protein
MRLALLFEAIPPLDGSTMQDASSFPRPRQLTLILAYAAEEKDTPRQDIHE